MNKYFFTALAAFLLTLSGYSQTSTPQNPIDQEFSELIKNSNDFKGYKVVDYGELTALQNKTSEYTNDLKEEISAYEVSLQAQKENIKELKADLANVQAQLEEVTAEKDEISFLGIPFSKASFKTTMWGIIGVLLLTLALLVIRFRSNNARTREMKQKLQETEKEFEAYRVKALEKEQRMGRLLQDERNKQLKAG